MFRREDPNPSWLVSLPATFKNLELSYPFPDTRNHQEHLPLAVACDGQMRRDVLRRKIEAGVKRRAVPNELEGEDVFVVSPLTQVSPGQDIRSCTSPTPR